MPIAYATVSFWTVQTMNKSVGSTKLVIISAWISRLIAAFSSVFALRVLSQSLAAPEYAIFVVVMGLAGWFALVDLGVGYAAQNAITKCFSRGGDASEEIVGAYLIVALTTSMVILIVYFFRQTISEALFKKILTGDIQEISKTFFYSALILIVGASLGISTKVLYGLHRGYIANFIVAIAPFVGLLLLVIGIESAEDKITYAIFSLYGPNALACGALAVHQAYKISRPRPKELKIAILNIVSTAPSFLVFNILGAAVTQIDYMVLSQKADAIEIIQYFTMAKIFSFVSFFNQSVLFAAWPDLTALYSTRNFVAIRLQLKRLVIITSCVTVAATVIVLVTKGYFGALLTPGKGIDFRYTVIIGFGAVALIRCLTDPFAIFLQSVGQLNPLIIFAGIQASLCISMQWIFIDYIGIEGVLLALLLSFILTTAWALPLASKKMLSGDSLKRS